MLANVPILALAPDLHSLLPVLARKREVERGFQVFLWVLFMFEDENHGLHQGLILGCRTQIKGLKKPKEHFPMGGVIPPDEGLVPVAMVRANLLALGQEGGRST